MAGDWIKMRTNLDTDPKVFAISEALELNELNVVGLLWKIWSWADMHSQDGNAVSVTNVRIDRIVGVTGFAHALRNVGWLEGEDTALTFPRFAEHNGKTAKTRAQTAARVKRKRNASSVTKALPEKRREEKSNTHTHTQREQLKIHPAVGADWSEAWSAWLETWEGRMGKPFDPIQAQTQLMDLSSRGDRAGRDLKFSQGKYAKSILDSDNDFSNRNSSGKRKQPEDAPL